MIRARQPGRGLSVRRRGCAARGMTLMEVMVAVALIAVLMGALMAFWWQAIRIRDDVARNSERMHLARQVLERIARELRGCLGKEQIGFPVEQRLKGDRRSLTMLTSQLPGRHQYDFFRASEELPPAQHDLIQVAYSLWVDPENKTEEGEPIVGGIIRTEKKTLNQFIVNEEDPEQVRNDLWCTELGYLEFRYFDGIEWDTKWDITEGNSLPQLVQITVGFNNVTSEELEDADLKTYPIAEFPYGDNRSHPDRYSLIVRIPAADRFFSSRVSRVGKQLSESLGIEGLEGMAGLQALQGAIGGEGGGTGGALIPGGGRTGAPAGGGRTGAPAGGGRGGAPAGGAAPRGGGGRNQ